MSRVHKAMELQTRKYTAGISVTNRRRLDLIHRLARGPVTVQEAAKFLVLTAYLTDTVKKGYRYGREKGEDLLRAYQAAKLSQHLLLRLFGEVLADEHTPPGVQKALICEGRHYDIAQDYFHSIWRGNKLGCAFFQGWWDSVFPDQRRNVPHVAWPAGDDLEKNIIRVAGNNNFYVPIANWERSLSASIEELRID